MKTIFLLLAITINCSAFSQKKKELDWYKNSVGQELRLSSGHLYTGMCLSVGGSIFIFSGVSQNQIAPTVAGSLICLTGVIFFIESHVHIKRAGDLLDKRGIGIASNGTGIVYRL